MDSAQKSESHSCGRLSLWLGLLGPPSLWLTQFELNYSLVPFAATSGNAIVLPASASAFLILSLACGVRPLMLWRAQQDSERHGKTARQCRHFMALLALGSVAIFTAIIAWQGIAAILISPRIEAR